MTRWSSVLDRHITCWRTWSSSSRYWKCICFWPRLLEIVHKLILLLCFNRFVGHNSFIPSYLPCEGLSLIGRGHILGRSIAHKRLISWVVTARAEAKEVFFWGLPCLNYFVCSRSWKIDKIWLEGSRVHDHDFELLSNVVLISILRIIKRWSRFNYIGS